MRLLSDSNFARDSRTSCLWQSFVTNQSKMSSMFRAAMAKMAIIGHARSSLVDCSEVLPPASSVKVKQVAT